jgi:hypothetical protein
MWQIIHPLRRADVETYILPDGASLLYDPVAEVGYPLDLLRSLIWDYCDGTVSTAEIAAEVAALLPQEAEARADASRIVQEFRRTGLLASDGG